MSSWWDDLQSWEERMAGGDTVGGEEYSPDRTIMADHNILAGVRNNEFDLNDPTYSRGLLLVGGLFLLVGLVAFLLLRFLVAFTAKQKTQLSERLLQTRDTSTTRGKALLGLAVTAAVALGCVVKTLFEVEVRMTKIEEATDEIVDSVTRGLSLPARATTSLLGVLTSYLSAQAGFDNCFYLDHDADEPVQQLEDGVKENMHILEGAGLDDLADGVDDVYLKILQMRDVRHRAVWPTMALCAALVATYLVLGARECRGGGRNSGARLPVPALVAEDGDDDFVASLRGRSKGRGCCDKRGRFLRFSTFLLAFLVWMTAAGSVTLSALSGDFCSNLDESVETVIADGNNSTLVAPLVEHYTGDCSERLANLAIKAIGAAQDVAKGTMGAAMGIMTAASKFCTDASEDVHLMGTSMKNLWDSLDEAAEVVSCPKINGLYRSAVWDQLCAELPGWLIALLVSCMVLSTLLLLLWVQWTLMLRKWREEEGLELGTIPFEYDEKPRKRRAGVTTGTAGAAAYVSQYGTASYVSDFGEDAVRHPVHHHLPLPSPDSPIPAVGDGGERGVIDFDLLPESLMNSRYR